MPPLTPARPRKLGIDVTNGNFYARLRVRSRVSNGGEGIATFTLNGAVNDSRARMNFEIGNCNWEDIRARRHSKFKLAVKEEAGVYRYKLFRKDPGAESYNRISRGTIESGAQGSDNVNQPSACT